MLTKYITMVRQVFLLVVLMAVYTSAQHFLPNVNPLNRMETTCFEPENGDSIYNYTYEDLKTGKNVSLATLRNKTILILNVASFCGFTYQYLQLNPLKEKFNGSLEIIGFPCNQFWKQEPGKNAYEIYNSLEFVRPGYGFVPKFPLSAKINVNGAGQNPLFSFLKQSCPAPRTDFSPKERLDYEPLHIRDIRWNFEKFLIAPKNGLPYKRYDAEVQPKDLVKDIEALKLKARIFLP